MPCLTRCWRGAPNRWKPAWIRSPARFLARRRRRLGSLVLSDRTEPADPATVAGSLADAVAADGLRPLPWTDAARQFQARVALMRGDRARRRLAGPERRRPDRDGPGLAAALPHRHRPPCLTCNGST